MSQNRTLGNKARYVRPDADCKNSKKCVFAQNYTAILALSLALGIWVSSPLAAHAQAIDPYYACFALYNNENRITSSFANSYSIDSFGSSRRGRISLSFIRDYCHDSGLGHQASFLYGGDKAYRILATRALLLPANEDTTDYVQSWDMSSVANQLGCAAAAGNQLKFPGLNQAIALLPQSPSNMRIPTLITKMAGENSLAGNLAIELYSGVWQFLGILTSFKLFKIFFKGG